jgi:HPt (histidine-containing phosphotransfer) domain-containing protein
LRGEINTHYCWSNTVTPSSTIRASGRVVFADQDAPKSVASEVLDREGLCARCLGNIDFVQRVLDKFQQRIPAELAELDRVLALNDGEQLARVAHRMKGTSANVSAAGLAQAAAEVEDLGRASRMADVPGAIERLRDEWEKYLNYVSTLFATIDTEQPTEQPRAAALW